MEKLNEEERKQIEDSARIWIENCGDSEIRRMYGHHFRSYFSGAEKFCLKKNEEIESLKKELETDKDFLDQAYKDKQIAISKLQASEERVAELEALVRAAIPIIDPRMERMKKNLTIKAENLLTKQ